PSSISFQLVTYHLTGREKFYPCCFDFFLLFSTSNLSFVFFFVRYDILSFFFFFV
ncbi:hypothetical protein L873DRAFT_1840922, partial [Choiromyces venosus 120613-1]